MASKPDAEAPVKVQGKGKKLMLIGGIVVLVLALAGGGALFFLSKKAAADGDQDEEVAHVAPKGPPTFLPLDNMVVNLADPGGEKVAQVGITLELADVKAVDKVKVYLPSIRGGVLLLISQRTAEELLLIDGKEKLAAAILKEAQRPFGPAADPHATPQEKKAAAAKAKKANGADQNPVLGVYFSSFIVQ